MGRSIDQARAQRYAQVKPAVGEGPRRMTGGEAYGGMQLAIRQPRGFAVGERSAHFDTLFATYIDMVKDPSRAKQKDPDVNNRMRQDLQVLGCLRVRQLATTQLKREWVPANASPEAAAVAKKFERWFDQQWRVSEALHAMLESILDGLSIQEMVWACNEDDFSFGLERMFPCYKDRFVFSKDGKLCLMTRSNMFYGELVHPWQFLQHVYSPGAGSWTRPEDEARLYWGVGLEENIYPNYFFKTVVLNLFTRWLQRLSSGVLIARYPYRNLEARGIVESLMEAYQEDESMAFPSGEEWGIDIKEATRAPADTYLLFIEYVDRQISKAILGSTLIIDQGDVGSQSLGEVHERTTFGKVAEFDRLGLEETLNKQWVPIAGQLNHVPKLLWPKVKFCLDPRSGAGDVLDALGKLQALGFDISGEMVSQETGFRAPRPGETILKAQPDAQGGFDLFGGGQEHGKGSPLTNIDLSTPQGLTKFRAIIHGSNHRRGYQVYQLASGDIRAPHVHTAKLDRHGNGQTSKGPGGHRHEVRSWKVLPDDKARHSHELLVHASDLERITEALAGPVGPTRQRYVKGWSPEDHPRGKPDNAGQFAPASGGGGGKKDQPGKKPGSPKARGLKPRPVTRADYDRLEACPAPAPLQSSFQNAAKYFYHHMLGKTFQTPIGLEVKLAAHDFFKAISGKKDNPVKGDVAGKRDWRQAFHDAQDGKLSENSVAGYEPERMQHSAFLPDLLQSPQLILKRDGSDSVYLFLKRYQSRRGEVTFLSAMLDTRNNEAALLSYHPRKEASVVDGCSLVWRDKKG